MLLSVLAFVGAATLIVLLPGPDTLVVVRSILRGGRRQGVLTALGNLTGLAVWVLAAALGIAALLHASRIGYDVLRAVGACYLIYLGVNAYLSRGTTQEQVEGRQGILGTGYRAGVLTNLLNPKVGVFFVTFLPGFIPHGTSVGLMTAVFGAIFVVLTALYWVLLLAVAGTVTSWMNEPRIRRRLDIATAGVLVGFGIRLATE
ncbi:MAG: rhtB [Marmoricola sp.]|nr:rhtB [Marmoricola sp.]